MAKSSIVYQCNNLQFSYELGNQRVVALDGVNLQIEEGGLVCLNGPSGSGKSTLLNLMGLIEPVQSGQLLFNGKDVGALSEREKNHIRRFELGFIFQNFHLIEVLRADENIEYFLARQKIPRHRRSAMVEKALKSVGLWEHRDKRPPQMSGGQRQRVAIARALAKGPTVIIADEPTASLDQATGRELMALLRRLTEFEGVTVIMASHDPMVLEFSTDIISIMDGQLVDPNPTSHTRLRDVV